MEYNLHKLEEKYKIKLDNTQKSVLSNLINFIVAEETHTICLKAPAGCGKSLILSMLYDFLEDNRYSCAFVAPTNKAKLVLTDKGDSNRTSLTIHSLLNLRPNLDIVEFNANQLEFKVAAKSHVSYDVLLIDECSMINDDLYNTLCKVFFESKIIFCGDPSQLAPVKQSHISKTFSSNTLELTKIYRQPESKLNKVLSYLRQKPLYKFKNVEDENGSIIVCSNILEMLKQYSYLFQLENDLEDQTLVKLITYTNNRINALNEIIRKILYKDNEEYHIREILTGYDSCFYKTIQIDNSRDYIVKKVNKTNVILFGIELNAYSLLLNDGNKEISIVILSKNNTKYNLHKIAEKLESLRQKAIKTKSRRDWEFFSRVYNSFLLPMDLYYQNRVIKRKSLDYGYCISAHKSQSSSYRIVMIDMENIWRCTNVKELRQLQYVACSRTTSNIIIYQKNG